MTPTEDKPDFVLTYPRGHSHFRSALDRCNLVSSIAYKMVGGARAFYLLDRSTRIKVREMAKVKVERHEAYNDADQHEAAIREGFVYVITHRYLGGRVKIGHARDPHKRLQQANCWCPQKLFRLAYAELFGDRLVAEASVHKFLEGRRHEGEWFEVTPQMAVEAINNAKQEVA